MVDPVMLKCVWLLSFAVMFGSIGPVIVSSKDMDGRHLAIAVIVCAIPVVNTALALMMIWDFLVAVFTGKGKKR
jgi:hypothetical protein